MAITKFDARQTISRDTLSQIFPNASDKELDDILRSIDSELTPPLRLDASATPDLIVSVGPAIVSNAENSRQKSIPHIGSLLPNSFTSGTITFPATSGNTITVSPGNNGTLTVTSNNYIKVLIYMDANGDLNVLPGVENAAEASATVLPAPTGTLPIGYVTLFNNAGTVDNIVQSKIFQFGTGAGAGGGAGDANSFIETLKNRLLDSPFEAVTPNVFAINEDNLLDGSSTGSYSLVTNNFRFSGAAETMVSVQMLDSPFLAGSEGVDEVELLAAWDLDNIDTGATYEVSRNGGNEWQTVTMTRVNSTELYRGIHEFDEEASNQTILSQTTKNTTAELNEAVEVSHLNKLSGTPTASNGMPSSLLWQWGQTFVPTNNISVDQITVGKLYKADAGSAGTLVVDLYTTSGGLPATLLATSASFDAGTLPVGSGSATDITFTFSSATDLTSGTTYAWVIRATASSGTNLFVQHKADDYASGNKLTSLDAGASFTANTGEDMFFELFDSTAKDPIGQLVTLSNSTELREVVLSFAKNGSPDGNIFVSIYDDSSGDPDNQLVETNAITIASLSAGDNTIDIPNVVLAAGTYHIVVRTDAAYKATFLTGVKSLTLDAASGGIDGEFFSGNIWVAEAYDLAYILKGIELDLRVRITSSVAANLDGYGILYDKGIANLATGIKNREVFSFKAVADNDNEFTLTKFTPETDLLEVYYIEAGQVFKYPAFQVDGQKIIFPVDSFNNGGVEADITLVFDQTQGGAFDNSDLNALLMAANHLGSTDGSISKHANGRGIVIARPDGVLREITINNSDNIVIKTTS